MASWFPKHPSRQFYAKPYAPSKPTVLCTFKYELSYINGHVKAERDAIHNTQGTQISRRVQYGEEDPSGSRLEPKTLYYETRDHQRHSDYTLLSGARRERKISHHPTRILTFSSTSEGGSSFYPLIYSPLLFRPIGTNSLKIQRVSFRLLVTLMVSGPVPRWRGAGPDTIKVTSEPVQFPMENGSSKRNPLYRPYGLWSIELRTPLESGDPRRRGRCSMYPYRAPADCQGWGERHRMMRWMLFGIHPDHQLYALP